VDACWREGRVEAAAEDIADAYEEGASSRGRDRERDCDVSGETACGSRIVGGAPCGVTRDESGNRAGAAEEETRDATDKMEKGGGGSSRVLDFDRDLGAAATSVVIGA
jgi:hypothetical protein